MFSALKKLVGSDQAPGRDKPIPAGLQSMNQALQRRFAKGVQYNMKIVIRGDRNTGKTTLWHRLQGKKFVEEYIPTQEIQVTSIHWNYKTTDDIVKVEVWDVVDKGQKIQLRDALGKCKKRGDSLKLENDPQEAESEMALDAEFLDVYKNCNGVVMMFDITKQWTFNYILKELPKVPTHVPVCVLGNYRDMGEHRVILPDDVREFIDNLNRPPGSSYFHYAESSMRNSFGLKYLHKFFNIPFLQLQMPVHLNDDCKHNDAANTTRSSWPSRSYKKLAHSHARRRVCHIGSGQRFLCFSILSANSGQADASEYFSKASGADMLLLLTLPGM
uniref:Rab-like protein 6 n=1 Tax=Sphaerodactylus townsendi TaxID=933632 RepID=A0ACB8EZE9_9SAUR